MSLLSTLTAPVRLRLVLAGAVALSVGSFAAGWTVRGWLADSQTLKVERQTAADKTAQRAAIDHAVATADAQGRAADAAHSTRARGIDAATDATKKEIADAQAHAAAAGSTRLLDPVWVRLHAQAVRPDGDPAAPAGQPTGAPAGAGDTHLFTEWDALWVDAENGRRFALCRSQLNALIDFETGESSPPEKSADPKAVGGDAPPVVTAPSGL